MTTHYLSIQGSYTSLHIGLLSNQICLKLVHDTSKKASSHLVLTLDKLLRDNNLTLSDLDFIALDHGPGAFTSLRVTIATVNALGFARQIPLIGIDGLEALWMQTHNELSSTKKLDSYDTIICLLNAYNNDVYYYVKKIDGHDKPRKGCMNIDTFLAMLHNDFSGQRFLVVGNGSPLNEEALINSLGSNLAIHPLEVASAEQIGLMGYEKWLNNIERSTVIEPNYMKTQAFKKSP